MVIGVFFGGSLPGERRFRTRIVGEPAMHSAHGNPVCPLGPKSSSIDPDCILCVNMIVQAARDTPASGAWGCS